MDWGFNWANLLASCGLMLTIIFALWRVFQVQFIAIERDLLALRDELRTREKELKEQFRDDRSEYLSRNEFRLFSERVIAELTHIRGQLTVLEQTRPTTGELEAKIGKKKDTI